MKNSDLAIFITEAPEFDEYQGIEYMTWIVFIAEDIDDDVKYTRCFSLDSAWDLAFEIKRKNPQYELVGL